MMPGSVPCMLRTADYQVELDEVIAITFLVKNPPEGKEGQKYRTRKTKGITLTKSEETRLGRRLPATWNPNSDDQLRLWLFGDLGLKPATKTKGGKASVDLDALSRIYRNLRKKDEVARPALWDLIHRARLQKIDQDYLDPEVVDGRVYPTIKMTGTESGRFSYADPPIHSWPDEVRHLVRPPSGRVWLGADYQALEARIFALLTNDTIDLEIFRRFDENSEEKEWDIHIRTAAELFGISISELLSKSDTQLKGMRVYSKNFRYGVLLYGGGPTSTKAKVGCPCPRCVDKAPPTVDVTPKERKLHADRWFAKHPNVLKWRDKVDVGVRRTHSSTTVMGKKRYFSAPWGPDVQREGWNNEIQSPASTIIGRAMRALDVLECPLCLQHHDALYAECPEGETVGWAAAMRSVMELPVGEFGGVVFSVDLEVGPSWGEMKECEK